jgi:hypothetical protein
MKKSGFLFVVIALIAVASIGFYATGFGATTDCSSTCQVCHAEIATLNHPASTGTPVMCIECHQQNRTMCSDTGLVHSGTPESDIVAIACKGCHGADTCGMQRTGAQLSVEAVNIHNLIPRTASFTWALGAAGNQIDFTVTSACESAPCTYEWICGDGSTEPGGATHTHTYPKAGNYLVAVKVADSTGALTMSPTRQITAVSQNTAPVASKLAPVVSGMTVTITDTSTDAEDAPGAMTATVLCGNSTVATGPDNTNLACTYTTAGSYTIRHSVKDTGGLGNSSANVTVSVGGSASRQTVSGTLTKQDGSPVSGATLYLQVGTQAKYVAVSAATTGNFTFTNVLPGTYTIRVIKGGLTFTNPAESDPASIVVVDAPVTGVVVKSIQ